MKKTIENDTFSGGKNTTLNATVGYNGSFSPEGEARSNTDYALGFSSAALELIRVAKESSEFRTHLDFLVYPICFNMRHAVELRLKKWWKDLGVLAPKRDIKLKQHRDAKVAKDHSLRGTLEPFPTINEAATHDLSKLWSLVAEYAPIIDSRFSKLIPLLDSYIQDIADIDPTGQTFRYPASNDSKTHLAETPLINIEILELRFTMLFKLLDFQEQITQDIKYEYSWTETPSQLSYYDLQSISLDLAKYKDIEGTSIAAQAKKTVTNRYSLSSNTYAKAIASIKSNHYLNYSLNITNNLNHLNKEAIKKIFDAYFTYVTQEEYLARYKQEKTIIDITSHNPDFEKIIQEMEKKNELSEQLLTTLTKEQIAEATALIECLSQERYIEIYYSLAREHIEDVSTMDKAELKSHISKYFFGHMAIEKLSSILFQINCAQLIQPQIENYHLTELNWYKKLHSHAFIRNYDSLYRFESMLERFQVEVTSVLSKVKLERLYF